MTTLCGRRALRSRSRPSSRILIGKYLPHCISGLNHVGQGDWPHARAASLHVAGQRVRIQDPADPPHRTGSTTASRPARRPDRPPGRRSDRGTHRAERSLELLIAPKPARSKASLLCHDRGQCLSLLGRLFREVPLLCAPSAKSFTYGVTAQSNSTTTLCGFLGESLVRGSQTVTLSMLSRRSRLPRDFSSSNRCWPPVECPSGTCSTHIR